MNYSIVAFLCTGPQDKGFDPICNTTHAIIALAGFLVCLFVGLAVAIAVVQKLLGKRFELWKTLAWAFGMTAGISLLVFLSLGL